MLTPAVLGGGLDFPRTLEVVRLVVRLFIIKNYYIKALLNENIKRLKKNQHYFNEKQ